MLYSLLTNNDKNLLKTYIKKYALHSGRTLTKEIELSKVLENWNKNKQILFKLLGNQLILSKNIHYNIDIDELYEMFCSKKEYNSFYNNLIDIYDNYASFETFKFEYLSRCFDKDNIINNHYSGEEFTIPLKNGTNFKVIKGMKIMKILKKISDSYEIKGFEKFRLAHSMCLNNKTIKGELCLSIHPMDYITMSDNECDWKSCMSYKEHGCYRTGISEMMNSEYVLVAYVKSENDMNIDEQYTWNNKKWRQLFIVSPHLSLGIKGYPYQCETVTSLILSWITELVDKNLNGEWPGYNSTITNYTCYHMKGFNRFNFSTNNMYNDVGALDKHLMVVNKNFGKIYPKMNINYSGPTTCLICGKNIEEMLNDAEDNENLVVCEDCVGHCTCAFCGESISIYNTIYIGEDNNHIPCCNKCFETKILFDSINHQYYHIKDKIKIYMASSRDCPDVENDYFMSIGNIKYNENWKSYFTEGVKNFRKTKDNVYYLNRDDVKPCALFLFNLWDTEDCNKYFNS